jgi:hypothetical protein
MTQINLQSSPLFDRIAEILVTTECKTMAPASLYRFYAKGFSYDTAELVALTDHLRTYAETGEPPERLVQKVADFPRMFSWFGGDIVGSDEALDLLSHIQRMLSNTEAGAGKHAFVDDATTHLIDLGVLDSVQELIGCPWPTETLNLLVAQHTWDPFYVMPNTIVCFRDDTYATYAVMLAHEGTHIATLDLVNDPDIVGTGGPVAGAMAEALAQAVQMVITDRCGIRYEDLFPGRGIHSHADYLQASPQRAHMAPMVRRLIEELGCRGDHPLREIYAQVYRDFAERSA